MTGFTGLGMASGRRMFGSMRTNVRAAPFVDPSSLSPIAYYDFSQVATLWKDTSRTLAVTTTGDHIAGVTDLSGNANHLAQATDANRPLYTTNAINTTLSVARTAGDTQNLTSAGFVGGDRAQPLTLFMVCKSPVNAIYHGFCDGLTSSKRAGIGVSSGDKWFMYGGTEVDSASTADTSFHIFAFIANGASSKLYVAGGAANVTGNAGTNPLDGVTLGSLFTPSLYLNNDMASYVVYSGALSTTNLDNVGNYYATRFGLTWSASS